ncbi:MAG: putative bifunctional diguanylate cyclase/phosphodiesterase [Frankiaceae bacterium]
MADDVELLRRLFERAPDGMVVLRVADGLIVLVNAAFSRLLDCPVDQIVGRASAEFGLWPAPAERARVLRSVRAHGPSMPMEMRLRTRAGGLRDVEISADIVEFAGVAHTFAITRDVSARKNAERALRDSEERFRALVTSSRDPILVTNAVGVLTYCSPGVDYLLGYVAEDLVGTAERDLFHPEDLRIRDARRKRLLQKLLPQPAAEMRMRRRDGTWRWVETIDTSLLDTPAVGGIVTNIRDISERKAAEQTQAFLALHDPLTGLPNRRLVDDRIEQVPQARRSGRTVAVLYGDLDRFKQVNDQGGHETGDELLRQMAARLREVLRPGDSMARVGGDEFVFVCPDLHTMTEAGEIAERAIAAAAEVPVCLPANAPWHVTMSIGIAAATGSELDELQAGTLLRNADAAMYRAKSQGRNCSEIFDAAMQDQADQRTEVQTQLRQALARGEFAVYFQPVVRLSDLTIVGTEALLRWQHPSLGLLTPGHFLDVAETSGLIVPVGDWVLSEVIHQLTGWRRSYSRELWASVNVSARQFRHRGFGAGLARLLQAHPLGVGALRLELTETVLIEHGPVITDELGDVIGLGVRVGIDDFGTGYSSLTYLQHLPISFLKIDASFVADLQPGLHAGGHPRLHGRSDLTQAILGLSHTLDIEAIAEGVETRDQAQALIEYGCTYAQGNLFSAPLPTHAMTALLTTGHAHPR